jgi:hypothetical protein
MEGCVISLVRGSADPLVEKFGSLADEDAPSLRLHTIKDDSCCLGSIYGCVIAETLAKFVGDVDIGAARRLGR